MSPVVARALTISVLLVATASCRRNERPDAVMIPNAATDDSRWSRLVVHATLDTPVGLKISPGVALASGRANDGGLLPAPGFQRVDSFPVQRRCRRGSMCAVVVRPRLGAVVFAFDPVVEVDLAMPENGARVSFPRYRDPESTSAALAKVHEQSTAPSRCVWTRARSGRNACRERSQRKLLCGRPLHGHGAVS